MKQKDREDSEKKVYKKLIYICLNKKSLLLNPTKTNLFMKKLFLNSANPINLSFGLLLIRVVIGVLMAFYGYEKLIHFDEMAASEFWAKNVSFLGMTGKIPLALTIFAEFFCSLLLIVGLLTRLALIPLLICMAYIVGVVGQFSIVESGDHGSNLNSAFVYFITYLGLYFTGAGKYSFDAMMTKR